MPNAELHAAITRRVLETTDGRDVQKIMDSTAHAHGPSHREDLVHSRAGLAIELAKQGKLTGDRLLAGEIHNLTDRAWSAMWSGMKMPSAQKRLLKGVAEEALVRALRPKRKRR